MKVYLDTGDLNDMREFSDKVDGFTTNPTLARRAGVKRYGGWGRTVASAIDKPVSFEVIADDPEGMIREARIIAGWGQRVYVKIPVWDTTGRPTIPVIATLLEDHIQLNITAICDSNQVLPLVSLFGRVPVIISVFAGRIADTGRDATQHIAHVKHMLHGAPLTEILWASTRQVYNIVEAELSGADIITMTPELIRKLPLRGKPLTEMTLDTVKQFAADAKAAGLEVT